MQEKAFIGIDLGGTTLTAGVISHSKILREKTVSTRRNRPAEEICVTICGLIEDVSNGYSIAGIGIGVPNPAEPESDRLARPHRDEHSGRSVGDVLFLRLIGLEPMMDDGRALRGIQQPGS